MLHGQVRLQRRRGGALARRWALLLDGGATIGRGASLPRRPVAGASSSAAGWATQTRASCGARRRRSLAAVPRREPPRVPQPREHCRHGPTAWGAPPRLGRQSRGGKPPRWEPPRWEQPRWETPRWDQPLSTATRPSTSRCSPSGRIAGPSAWARPSTCSSGVPLCCVPVWTSRRSAPSCAGVARSRSRLLRRRAAPSSCVLRPPRPPRRRGRRWWRRSSVFPPPCPPRRSLLAARRGLRLSRPRRPSRPQREGQSGATMRVAVCPLRRGRPGFRRSCRVAPGFCRVSGGRRARRRWRRSSSPRCRRR